MSVLMTLGEAKLPLRSTSYDDKMPRSQIRSR